MSFLLFIYLVFSKLSKINILLQYLFISAYIFVIWLFLYAIYYAITSKWLLTSFFFLKYFMYPYILLRIPFIGIVIRLKVLITLVYIIINILLITIIGVKSRVDIGTRAAIILIINLIPLLYGPQLSLITKMLGISLRTSIGTH